MPLQYACPVCVMAALDILSRPCLTAWNLPALEVRTPSRQGPNPPWPTLCVHLFQGLVDPSMVLLGLGHGCMCWLRCVSRASPAPAMRGNDT